MQILPRRFYARSAPVVAPDLLNKVIQLGALSGRIVETEAYGGADDPASHGHRRETDRNRVMFGPPGHLYVYFTYGMHHCACIVTGQAGESSAVLLRALEPIDGLDTMRGRRTKARRPVDLTNGPAKLAQAFALTVEDNGLDICRSRSPLKIFDDGMSPPPRPLVTTRVGLTKGVELPWRWCVPNHPSVSPGRPSGSSSEDQPGQ